MAVTGQKVYELALSLIDEVSRSGAINLSDMSLKTKSLQFLTVLQAEMLPTADGSIIVTDLNAPLALTDRECLLVLPYGLASHLTVQDDPASASFFQQRYEELRKRKRATIGPIVSVYTKPKDECSDIDEGELDGGGYLYGSGNEEDGSGFPPDDDTFDGGVF